MKKYIVLLLSLVFTSGLCVYAQKDYKKEGMAAVARGDYADAETQFKAERSVLDSKRINKNSDEYIAIEKLITYATQCKGYASEAKKYLAALAESNLQAAFAACSTETEAEEAKESLLAKLNSASSALRKITEKFPGDRIAKSNLEKCPAIERQILQYRNNFTEILAWRKASSNKSLTAYTQFLEEFPSGLYASSAKSAINEIREQQAWDKAERTEKLADYQDYLAEFPDGEHSSEAQRIVKEKQEE